MIKLSNLPAFLSEFSSHPTPNFNYAENKENIAIENTSEIEESKHFLTSATSDGREVSLIQRVMKDIQATLQEYKQYYKVEKLELQLTKLDSLLKQTSKGDHSFKLKYKRLKREYKAK